MRCQVGILLQIIWNTSYTSWKETNIERKNIALGLGYLLVRHTEKDWLTESEKPHDTIPIFIIHQPGTTNQTPTMMNCRNAETPCRTKSKLNNKTAVSLPYHSADLPPSSSAVVSFHNNIGYHSITTLLLPLCYVQRPAKTTIPSTFIIIPLAVTDQSIGALPSSISLSHMSAPSAPVNYICTEAMVTWLLPERYCTSTYQL